VDLRSWHTNATAALAVLAVCSLSSFAQATDHNNIAAGRPLRFDDARTIELGDQQIELGFGLTGIRDFAPLYTFGLQYRTGFAAQQQFGIGINHFISNGNSDTGTVFFHYMRELSVADSDDAFGFVVNVGAPYGTGSDDTEVNLRGVATRAMGGGDRLHVNADFILGEHRPGLGLILGYSRPLGGDVNQTLVGEVGINRLVSDEWILTLGLGIRRQFNDRAVLDFGILFGGLNRDDNRTATFNIGYSMSF